MTTGLLASPSAGAEPAAAPVPGASTYTPLTPVRVLDTRAAQGPVGAGRTITLDLSTKVPNTVTAVVLNVTAVTPTANTYVTAFPAGAARPNTSSLNLPPGDTRANQVTVMIGANRGISLYNNAGNTHLVADLAGYYATGGGDKFTALPANRVFDTRRPNPPIVGPADTRIVDLSSVIPASATAVTFNLTATEATASTFVTAWPTGTSRPTASNVNVPAGDTRPNLVTVAVGPNRQVSLFNNAGQVHLIVDLAGFYTPDYGASFVPLPPSRFLDTRDGTGTGTPGEAAPNAIIPVDLADRLPLTATGVALNVTGVNPSASTFVTVTGTSSVSLGVSTLNLSAGQTAANAAVAAFDTGRTVRFVNANASLHLVADLVGVFAVSDSAECTDDCLYAWGANGGRKLGTAEAVESSADPKPVLSGVRTATGNASNGYALRTDGTVWAWGDNSRAQLGNGWRSSGFGGGSAAPARVLPLHSITAIAAGGDSGYALRNDGTVWAWGGNDYGQLGSWNLGTSPVQVPLTNVTAIAASGQTAYALRTDGTVWAWGNNSMGQLGNGSTVEYSEKPAQVSGLSGVTAITGGGDGAYALRSDGTVWAWGSNAKGQLGNGQPCQQGACESAVPVQVAGLTGVTMIAAGDFNGYAALADGTVWSWGGGQAGLLGNGTNCETCESRVPVRVSNLSGVTQLASADNAMYALGTDGALWGWGDNRAGALANDDVATFATVPVPVGVSSPNAIGGGAGSGYAIVP